jgi:hypothetical protein
MPFYFNLKRYTKPDTRNYYIERILRLKAQLDKDVPHKKEIDDNLLLATWNIRDFGKVNRRGYGSRTSDSLMYIAEIISRFDLIAVQEVNEIEEFKRVMRILGPDWDYIASDVTDSSLGGNGERMLFVFDTRKILFRKIAGEIVLPKKLEITKAEYEIEKVFKGKKQVIKVKDGRQFRRTPYSVSFQSGWFKFDLCTVHIYYGSGTTGMKQRVQEIASIAKFLKKVGDKKLASAVKTKRTATILLGDFNIMHPEHETMKSLLENGFNVPEPLQKKTNAIGTKYYDQIAFLADKEVTDFIENDPENNAGVLDITKSVFRKNNQDDIDFYTSEMLKSSNGQNTADIKKYYNDWRTYQMSDHNVLWTRLKTNNSIEYLNDLKL